MGRTSLRWQSPSSLVRPQSAVAPMFVQGAGADSATASVASQDVTLPAPATAGNLIVVCGSSDATISTPSGYSLAVLAINAQACYIWWKIASGGETTATLTPSVSRPVAGGIAEYLGIAASPLDQTATATGTGSSTTGPVTAGSTPATSQASELVVAVTGPHSYPDSAPPTSPTWTNGYTGRLAQATAFATNTQNAAAFLADLVVASVGAQSTSASWTNSAFDWGAVVATFKGA